MQSILRLISILVLISDGVLASAPPHVLLLARGEGPAKQPPWKNKLAVAFGIIGGVLNAFYLGWWILYSHKARKDNRLAEKAELSRA